MNIGNIELSAPLALAPMAGITDLPFRLICRRLGCGMTVSEMVSAKGLLYKNVKTTEMLRIDDGERPTAIQLFGSVPAELAEAARMVEASGADLEVLVDDQWVKTRMEMNLAREWYLVGTPYCGDLEYVRARIPE